MSLNFNSSHKAYADAVMIAQAHKLFKKRAPSTKAAAKASYNSSIKADTAARKGTSFSKGGKKYPYKKSWSTATARSINKAIEKAAKSAIKTAGKKMVKKGKLVTSADIDGLVQTAALGLGGVAIKRDNAPMDKPLSRRKVFGLSLGAVALVTIGGTTSAMADNTSYIKTVKNGAKGYTGGKAPAIIRNIGALGIRG